MGNDLVDRNEALNLFIKGNFKLILSEPFPKEIFKKAKLTFFMDGHKNVGVPRDEEIAGQAAYYFIRNGVISSEDKLCKVLSLPFFAKNIRNKEPFLELLRLQKSTIAIVEPKKLSEAEVREKVRQEIKQEIIEEQVQDIEDAIEKKREEYLLVPSILDQQEFEELVGEVEPSAEEEFLPWWKHLKLTGDPFPIQEGLAKIADDLYEKVVYKTPIFEKHLVLMKESPEELFKDTIFFGEFGSGKTTLFDYLKKPLMNEKIFAIYIQLYAESTFQALLAKFNKKLFERLCELYELLYDADPRVWLKSPEFQDNIISMLQKFCADDNVKGLVIIIDNLHKNFDEFEIAMKFVNNLQLFKGELVRQIPNLNLGILIAGSAEWEKTIKNQPKFQGSYIRHETMPSITEEAAYEMLNKRLSAFATNPDTIKTIDIGFVRRIYRGLQNNKLPITFRSFIRAALDEFEKSNFTILSVDPVHLSKETLAEIKETIEWNKILKKRFDNILFGGGIQKEENRKKTLELLISTYLQRGIPETSKVFQDNKFGFQRLAKSGLIQKSTSPSGFKWVVCKELDYANRTIMKEHNLSLEDYLTKIFVAPLHVRPAKVTKTTEELGRIDSLINVIANKEVKGLARASRDKHEAIIEQMERHERTPESANAVSDCITSLALLTKALARFLGLEVAHKDDMGFMKEFWKDFWFSPGEVSEFINQAERFGELRLDEHVWYSCMVYRDAYTVLLGFFEDEVDKSRYMMIPIAGLTNDEIKQFHEIRNSWAKHSYFEVADQTSRLVEKKLRLFLFNVFTLLFGEQEARLSRLDKATREYILQNAKKDQVKGLGSSKNEFEQVNRGNYKNFMISSYDREVGRRNWTQVFKQVFAPLAENDIKNFLDMLAEFNIATSHVKQGAFGAEQQTRIFNYVLKSIDAVRKMNDAYRRLVETGLHVVEEPIEQRKFYFSLLDLEDKDSLTPAFAKDTNAKRIVAQLLSQDQLAIDLEDSQFIESLFSIAYREFMTILARLIIQTPMEAKKTGIRVEIVNSRGCIVMLSVSKR